MAKRPRKAVDAPVPPPRPPESEMESALRARLDGGDMAAWDAFLARVDEWEAATGLVYAEE